MQGKGLIKFFLVVMAIICALQSLYVFKTRGVEQNAMEYATQKVAGLAENSSKKAAYKAHEITYLDSMSSEVVMNIPLLKKFTYQDLKQRQLAYGLDLKGGMSVVLQVDLQDFIKALSNNSKDATFLKALKDADIAQRSEQSDYVALFADAWNDTAGGKKLASIFTRNQGLRNEINSGTSDGEVIRLIRTKANETVGLTFKRLKERIDKLGVVQPNVSLDAARDMIIVELPGIDNPERARAFLQSAAKLEFWNVYRCIDQGVVTAFEAADKKLKQNTNGADAAAIADTEIKIDTVFGTDELGNIDRSNIVSIDTVDVNALGGGDKGPLLSKLELNVPGLDGRLLYSTAVMGVAVKNQRKAIDDYLNRTDIKALFPRDMVLRWGKDAYVTPEGETTDKYELYAIKKERGKDAAPLEGDRVITASSNTDENGQVVVSLTMDQQGARTWGIMTQNAAQDSNREIAITLDNEVVSAPRVTQAITGGRSQITGNFSIQEAKDLANILQVGKLPATPRIIQETLVGPSLGADNIRRSLTSLFVGFGLLLAFMLFYYGSGGLVSIIALLLNIVFVLGALASFGTVLTLPGIAGIVLTIGMAVDANVIIYERIREEIREGKSFRMAVSDGFSNSYSAIIDANVTTILTAFVLIYFGLGPIKGFAVVLAIGVVSSVFTAVLVGRMIIEWWAGKGNELTFWTGATKNAFVGWDVDWLSKRKLAYMISGTVIALGFVSFFARGFDLGVDFKGGYSYNVEFVEGNNMTADQLRSALTAPFGATPTVKKAGDNTFNVTTSYLIDDTSENAADLVMDKLYEGVSAVTTGIDKNEFKAPDGSGVHVTSSSKVGPTIADDISKSAFYAAIFALLLIFLYIFIRFSKWQYSAGAVAALAHDTLVVLSIFSIGHSILPFSMEIDQAFIAAILTVIGYSINDTVVVFDRIREFMNTYSGKTKNEIINMAVNSTISRTVITSLTTLFVVFILFVFSSGSIKSFAFALLIGIIVGTYSSVFVATPVMADLTPDLEPKESTKKKKSFSRAVK